MPEGVEPIAEGEFLEPTWRLALHPTVQNRIYDSEARPLLGENALQVTHVLDSDDPSSRYTTHYASQKLPVTLQENYRMTPPNHWQDVRHLVLTSKSKTNYGPGDVLTIHPKNFPDDVEQLLKRMNWTEVADKPVHFTQTNVKDTPNGDLSSLDHSFTTTLRRLLTEHLDITAIPRRSFFSLIAHFTDDQFHKDRLLEFTKPEFIDELYDYTTRPRRSILEVLQEFESVKIPWQWAAAVLPELRGRQFSIASGGILKKSSEGDSRFELLVAIVKYKTVIKKMREGVCTRYLATLPVGTELNVTLQEGGLAISKGEARRPVVMIGPGTGVAPIRSLIWERRLWLHDMEAKAMMQAVEHDNRPGKIMLFFGCRSEGADYFYHEEWADLKTKMDLEVHPAFSRDQGQKVYVQDLIRKQSETVYSLLHDAGGLVYVCGSSGKMPQAVRAALVDVFKEGGRMDQSTADKYLEVMEREGRYKQETW